MKKPKPVSLYFGLSYTPSRWNLSRGWPLWQRLSVLPPMCRKKKRKKVKMKPWVTLHHLYFS